MNWSESRFTWFQLLVFAVVLLSFGFLMGTIQYNMMGFAQQESQTNSAYDGPASNSSPPENALQVAKSLEKAINYASEKTRPAVVTIYTKKKVKAPGFKFPGPDRGPFNEFFKRFFDVPEDRSRKVTGLGSGVIIRENGYIVTNHHVIAKADEIKVMLFNRESVSAEVVGSDENSDLAVLKIDKKGLPSLDFANSDNVKVGEYAIAIGSPFQMRNSVSVGHVSAMHRAINANRYEDLIQTDAAINRGNSGGPLVNIQGEIIGINTLILSKGARGSQGVGFAISSSLAKGTANDLIEFGEVKRPWLGVVIQQLSSEMQEHLDVEHGAIVAEVKDGSPADKAGIESGDVILSFDGTKVQTPHDLQRMVLKKSIDDKVTVQVKKEKGEITQKTITLGLLPGEKELKGKAKSDQQEEKKIPDNIATNLGLAVTSISANEAEQNGIMPPRPYVVVERVKSGSPADRANLERGDIVLSVEKNSIRTVDDFTELLTKFRELGKEKVILRVRRDNSNFFTLLPIGS